MESLYINLSNPPSGNERSPIFYKIFGYLFVALAILWFILELKELGLSMHLVNGILYLLIGLSFIFRENITHLKPNFVKVNYEKIEFKLGMILKQQEMFWDEISSVKIEPTNITFSLSNRVEIIKTDWMLYKDVKEFKSFIREICKKRSINIIDN